MIDVVGAIDALDERNYTQDFDMYKDIPKFIINESGHIQDQYKAGYRMGCVYFSCSENVNCMYNDRITEGGDLCDTSDTRSKVEGDLIINGPKHLKKLGYIDSYFQVKTLKEALYILSTGKPIHTGSKKIDWKKTKDIAVTTDKGIGHSFHIIGYNLCKGVFICKNSVGDGYFYIRLEDWDCLFNTKLYFELSKGIFYKKKIMDEIKLEAAKCFVRRGLTNGERPTEPITREELWAIMERVIVKYGLDS